MHSLTTFLQTHWPAIVAGWAWSMVHVAPWLVASAIPAAITGLTNSPRPGAKKIVVALRYALRALSWAEHHDMPGTFKVPVLGDLWKLLAFAVNNLVKVPPAALLLVLSLGVGACAHGSQAGFTVLEAVATSAKAAKDGFAQWDLGHLRAVGCPVGPACEAYLDGPARAGVVKADAILRVALAKAEMLMKDNPKADPGSFLADVLHAAAELTAAVSKAEASK